MPVKHSRVVRRLLAAIVLDGKHDAAIIFSLLAAAFYVASRKHEDATMGVLTEARVVR
jgi:ribosomal protein S7